MTQMETVFRRQCEDTDDDGDTWSDEDEVTCGSDPLDSVSIPTELDADGNCVVAQEETDVTEKETAVTEKETKDSDNDSSSSNILWPATFCCLLLLLLLLIPLMYLSKERGDSLLVLIGMRNGPEPENTTSKPKFVSGSGTKTDHLFSNQDMLKTSGTV